jgi:putative endopeptidase
MYTVHNSIFMKKYFFVFATLLSVLACKNNAKEDYTVPARDVVAANIDTSTSPSEDFFQFANGGWFKANPIPPSESSWGIGKMVQEDIYAKMRKVSETAAANTNATLGSNEQKIGDFWAMGMDTLQLEKLSMMPLMSEFALIESITDKTGLLDMVGYLQTFGMNPLFGGFIYQDLKNSNQYAMYLWQGGLGLPERDYYFNTDVRNTNIRKEYVSHIAK